MYHYNLQMHIWDKKSTRVVSPPKVSESLVQTDKQTSLLLYYKDKKTCRTVFSFSSSSPSSWLSTRVVSPAVVSSPCFTSSSSCTDGRGLSLLNALESPELKWLFIASYYRQLSADIKMASLHHQVAQMEEAFPEGFWISLIIRMCG